MGATGDDSSGENYFVKGQERIERALTLLTEMVNRKFDELGQRYVPREELNNQFASIKDHQQQQDQRLATLESGRNTDRVALGVRIDKVEELRRSDRINSVVIAISVAGLALTALVLIIAHWH